LAFIKKKENTISTMHIKSIIVSMLTLAYNMGLCQQYLVRAFQPAHVVNHIPYGAYDAVGNYVKAQDANIYYEVYGSGPAIVLLHGGLFGSTIEYADMIDKLKRKYQVIAISTRGHGRSELGTSPMTLHQRAADAMAVINAVTKDSVTVIGFSDGGYSAYMLAAMYPERIKKMVVIGAGELKPGIRDFTLTAAQAVKMDKAYWDQQLKLMPEPQRFDEVFTQVVNFYNNATVGKDLLGNIKCPVMLMAGDKDDGNPVERIVSAARCIPRHHISIIPNAGHVCHNDNFDAAWQSIAPFLETLADKNILLKDENLIAHQVSCTAAIIDAKPALQVVKNPSIKEIDEATFVKIKNSNFLNGEIEVKILSRLLPNASTTARGFIGIAFRINEDNSKFEAIYLRPTNGKAQDQVRRNHSIQYFSFPDYKYDRLRKEAPEAYESYADMDVNEWITMKVVVKGSTAKLYLNDNAEPSLIVNDLKHGSDKGGSIGLWVDVGTEGYFRDLKVTDY
jgi:pimeloyl-ACP methyl ester carboxylesterase